MPRTLTILHTRGCPNVALLRQRVGEALTRTPGSAPTLVFEEVGDPEKASRLGFQGSPTLLVDGRDPFATPTSPPALACRTYANETGMDGAPSVDQIVAALTAG